MNIDINLKVFSFQRRISLSRVWIQYGIIVAAILASFVIPYWGSRTIMVVIPGILGAVSILLILLKQLNIGFILIILAGMFVPFVGPGGVNASILIAIILIGFWLMNMFVVKRNFYFIRSRVLLPVFAMMVTSVVAFGMGQVPWFVFGSQAPLTAQLGGFAVFILSLGVMVATAHLIRDVIWLKGIVWLFIILGGLYVIGRSLRLPVHLIYQRGFTAQSMFWTWLVALSFSQVVFNHQLKTRSKIVLYVILTFTFYTALVQAYDWKSGWIPPLIVVAVILGVRYPRLIYLAIPVALVMGGYVINNLISSDEYSWGTRVDAWIIVLSISQSNPLFGLGFANYFWYTPLFSIRGYHVNFNSHSQYVDLIAQVGFIGLLFFLWIFFEVGKLSWRLSKKSADGFEKAYAYGVLAGCIGTLAAAFLVDWVLPFVYNVGLNGFRASILPWIFCGGLISLEYILAGKIKSNSHRGVYE